MSGKTRIIGARIDVDKIDKKKLFQGKNGRYLSIDIIVNEELDEYGNDTTITVQQSKSEREAKEKKVYLGNGKTVWTGDSKKKAEPKAETPAQKQSSSGNEMDDLPF